MRNFWILLKDNFLSSLRAKKTIVFVILYFVIFAVITYSYREIEARLGLELMQYEMAPEARNAIFTFARDFLKVQEDNKLIDFLMTVPFYNVILFLVTLFATPLLILIVKYDTPVQEISEGTMRYLVFRVSRIKIILAKFLSSIIEFFLLTFLVLVIALLWAKWQIPYVEYFKNFKTGIHFWLVVQPFLYFFIAFSLMISVIVRRPITSLLFSFLGILFFAMVPIWLKNISPFDIKYFRGLFYDSSPELYTSIGIYTLCTFIFLGIAIFIFNRRDL